jgi:predicted outer membrane repeat protein
MGAYEYQGSKIIYVDADATGANNGSSWADAYNYLQDALMMALDGDEIRVAQGVYKPDQFVLSDRPCRGREETFQLINGVALKGGYAGFGQPDQNARDIELYETILSGDLDSNDIELEGIESSDFIYGPSWGENSYTVVTGSGTDSTAVLDGFTVTGGNSNGQYGPEGNGGGMYNHRGNPTVQNCTFRRNSTRGLDCCFPYIGTGGGGVFNLHSSPTLQNCRFEENIAFGADEFASGGGMYDVNSQPTLIGCTFARNIAYGYDSEYYGGAIFDYNSSTNLTNCSFINNWSHSGGALYSTHNSSAMLTGCLFVGNYAYHGGGAIFSSATRLNVVNCTFAENRAPYGNIIDCDPWQTNSLKAINSILWNGGNEVSTGCSDAQIDFSDIQGGWEGEGDTNVDPCFAQPGRWDDNGTPDADHDDFWVDGDYHLKSQAGRWNASEGRWTIDEATSPCIDAGDPLGPIGLEPFPNGGIVNMGAYGGTAEASKSYFGKPPCETIFAGDINGDCEVDFRDFAIMALHWLENYQP